MLDTNIGFNSLLNNLKNDMADVIKKSGLPISVVYYITKDLFAEITEAYKETLLLESQNNNNEENEKNEN